jgi:hypothetical protein
VSHLVARQPNRSCRLSLKYVCMYDHIKSNVLCNHSQQVHIFLNPSNLIDTREESLSKYTMTQFNEKRGNKMVSPPPSTLHVAKYHGFFTSNSTLFQNHAVIDYADQHVEPQKPTSKPSNQSFIYCPCTSTSSIHHTMPNTKTALPQTFPSSPAAAQPAYPQTPDTNTTPNPCPLAD